MSYFHYWDELVYLQDAKVICCGKTNYSELFFRPPLLSLFFAALFLIHDHIFVACIFTALLNAAAPLFLFLSGRRIVGTLSATLASILLAFGPFFVGVFPRGFDSDDTGNSLLTDSPALTLVLLALWLMLRALEKEKATRFFFAGFAVSLTILMRFGSIPAAGFLCLLPLLASVRWRSCLASAAGVAAGFTPYLVWSRVTSGSFFGTLQQGWKNVEGPEPPFTFYLTNAPTIFTWISVLGLLLAAFAALRAVYRQSRTRPYPRLPLALLPTPSVLQGFLWIWLIGAFLFFSRMPHKEPRYIIPLAPAFLLLAASGLALVSRLRGMVLRPLAALALGAAMIYSLYPSTARFAGPFIETAQPEELQAARFLQATFPQNTTLYMNFNYPAFAFYSNFGIATLPIGGPEVYQAIDRIPKGGLLVAYRNNESGEPRIDLLHNDPHLQVVKAYNTLVIYRHI